MKILHKIALLLKHHPEGLILTYLAKILYPKLKNDPTKKKEFHAKYVQISRIIDRHPELFQKLKIGNLVCVKLKEPALDLLRAGEKFKRNVKSPASLRRYPKRCREQRINAIKVTDSVKILGEEERDEIEGEFQDYLEEVDNRKIVLRRKAESSNFLYQDGPKYKILPYITRFTDRTTALKNLDKMDVAFDYMSRRHKKGVHLTLTTDPKRFYSLYAANRHFSIAFNRYMSFLARKRGKRLHYIAAYEYTKSGLLHAHILFFGISWLSYKHAITKDWDRCGQGCITYVYSVKNDNGRWIYTRKKPSDLKEGKTAKDYLKKYLKKSIDNPQEAMLYWAFNKRFFSCTRAALATATGQQQPIPHIKMWEFFMSATYFTMPDFVFQEVVPPPH